jgi:uncharacterized protein
MDQVVELPEDFNGRVRLFPLPDLVVFPHAMQPLHIFEPRYCDMLGDALASDRLLAMATLCGGSAHTLHSEAAIYPTVCIGKIVSHSETDSGGHNILLIGAQRATILRELPTNRSFRLADVEVAVDFHAPAASPQRQQLKREVLAAFAAVIPPSATVQQNLHELMAGQMGLGPITDIIAYTLPLPLEAKLALLAEANVGERAKLLVRVLKQPWLGGPSPGPSALGPVAPGLAAATPGSPSSLPRAFPPPFSQN